jgi:gluconokinase
MAVVVVMGVSGSGKSTIGALLARTAGWAFEDADDLHPPANVARMRAGVPLTDEDRGPWLDAVAGWISTRSGSGVLACSALKRRYRDRLRQADPGLRLVFLDGTRDILAARLSGRAGHFFPEALLDSQLADLEPPGPDEHPITVHIGQSPEYVVQAILTALGTPGSGPLG